MTSVRRARDREDEAFRLRLGIRDYVYLSLLLVGFGSQWAKVDTIRTDLEALKTRYANEVVPRAEHMQMNQVTEERWRAVGDRLTHVEGQLEAIQRQLLEIRGKQK